jgi:hypothetical protein
MTPEDVTPRIVLELNAVFCLDAIDRLKWRCRIFLPEGIYGK